jgi:hypothetical protein
MEESTPAVPPAKSLGIVATVLSVTIGLGMLAFGFVLRSKGCFSCSTGVPPEIVIAAGIAWAAAGTVAFLGRTSLALGGAALLLSAHLGLMAFAGGRACPYCLGFLAAEAADLVLTAVWTQRSSSSRWLPLGAWVLATGLAGFAGTSVGIRTLWPVMPTRTLGSEQYSLSDPRTTVIYVIAHRGCRPCDIQNDRLVAALQRGLPIRAMIVDQHSEMGHHLMDEHNLIKSPAFVAKRGRTVLGTQDGGNIDIFLHDLERRGVW